MSRSAPVIWADIDLMPEARTLIAESGLTLEQHLGGSLEGVDGASAIVAGSLLNGDAQLFARAPGLLVIARCGIGCDRIDIDAATEAGVCAVNTPDAPTESTAEFAIALMLAVARRVPRAASSLAIGEWHSGAPLIGFDLACKTLGLVGCGRIGRRVAEIAQVLHMEVQAFDPMVPELPEGVRRAPTLDDLLATSDIISLHVPLSNATRHLLDGAAISRCKPGAVLINTARGPLVDEAALCEALRSGHLGGAGIDVWDPEPNGPDNPLLRLHNVVATPHMAAFTNEGRRRSHVTATEQVIQVLLGQRPPFLLNPPVWPGRRTSRPKGM